MQVPVVAWAATTGYSAATPPASDVRFCASRSEVVSVKV
jgi:hypothetical protein